MAASALIDGPIIDAGIARMAPGSPLVGQGRTFAMAADQYGIDWRLLVAIAYAETSLGRTGNAAAIHNPFGLGPGIRFNSWGDSIARAAEVLGSYRDDGLTTVATIGARWAPQGASNDPSNLNSNWVRNVTAALVSMGGDPEDVSEAASGPATIPGDAQAVAGDVAGAVTEPLAAVADLAARLVDRSWWIRVGMVVGGVGALGLGVVLIGRSVITSQA